MRLFVVVRSLKKSYYQMPCNRLYSLKLNGSIVDRQILKMQRTSDPDFTETNAAAVSPRRRLYGHAADRQCNFAFLTFMYVNIFRSFLLLTIIY